MKQPQIYPGEVFADNTLFDRGIRQLIPRYDLLLDTLVSCVPSDVTQILELGCGTGELSSRLLKNCPLARLTALDYSPRMVAATTAKLTESGLLDRARVLEMDFGAWGNGEVSGEIGTDFDACVSSLAIHHLDDEMKRRLFGCIARNLKGGGCFWNADPVVLESRLSEAYEKAREEWTRGTGTTLEEVRLQLGNSQPYGYSGQDRLATLDAHLAWLKEVGFDAFGSLQIFRYGRVRGVDWRLRTCLKSRL
jgi:tRNA (cmo5U34)-methyltransferase